MVINNLICGATRICGRSPTSREESRNKTVWIVKKGERIAVELLPILVARPLLLTNFGDFVFPRVLCGIAQFFFDQSGFQ